jgi:hypothetical protein
MLDGEFNNLFVNDLLVEIMTGHLVEQVVVDGFVGQNHSNPKLVAPPQMNFDPLPLLHPGHKAGVEIGVVVVEKDPVRLFIGPTVSAESKDCTRKYPCHGEKKAGRPPPSFKHVQSPFLILNKNILFRINFP